MDTNYPQTDDEGFFYGQGPEEMINGQGGDNVDGPTGKRRLRRR